MVFEPQTEFVPLREGRICQRWHQPNSIMLTSSFIIWLLLLEQRN